MRTRIELVFKVMALVVCAGAWQPRPIWAQADQSTSVEQPDAQRAKDELSALLDHYPPALHNVLALDPGLLGNQAYLAPYPALVSFLNRHPEVARNPSFYLGEGSAPRTRPDQAEKILDMWREAGNDLAIFAGFGLAVGLLVWLIRTLVDYRRWSRLSKVQTEVHTKLLDRFTANDDLLAYIQSPAGAKFLESSPIALDAAPRGGTDSVVGARRRGAAGRRSRPPGDQRTSGGCHVATIAAGTGRIGHRAGPGFPDFGDNFICDLAAAGIDRTALRADPA